MTRRATVLLVALSMLLLSAVGTSASAATGPDATAAALKKCKKGLNSKRCRCPRGYKLVKKGRKYRCRKRATTGTNTDDTTNTGGGFGTNTGTNTGDNTGTTTNTGGGTTEPPPQNTNGAQLARDDAAYTAALQSNRYGPRTDEGSTGIFTYTYNFCANRTFNLHSEYFSSSYGSSDTYYNGNWEVEQGYRVVSSPNGPGYAGILIMRETDGTTSLIELDFNDSAGYFTVGNSAHLAGGQFSRSAASC